MKPPKLVALHTDVKSTEHVIDHNQCTLGRHTQCKIVIHRKTVSRLHATIECAGPHYLLYDSNSANGTFVNGHRIYKPYQLQDKDEIGLASPMALLLFKDPDSTLPVHSRLRYNDHGMTFTLNNKSLKLTAPQFHLLHHLYQHASYICTRESCAEALWERAYDPALDADALDRAVSKLRARLREIDPQTSILQTRRGLGYVLYP